MLDGASRRPGSASGEATSERATILKAKYVRSCLRNQWQALPTDTNAAVKHALALS